MEKFISEMFGFLLTVVMMAGLFLTGLLWYNVNQFNSFKNQTEQVVERTGGISDDAIQQLNDLSNTYYHDHFQVGRPVADDKSVPYGAKVTYSIHSNIPLSLYNDHISDPSKSQTGSSRIMGHGHNSFFGSNYLQDTRTISVDSQVRQNSQQNITNTTHGGHFKATKVAPGYTHNDYHNHNNNNGAGFSNGEDNSKTAIQTPQND